MSEPITRPVIAEAVDKAVRASAHLPPAQAAAQAKADVLSDPVISKATTPIAWYKSQAIIGSILAFVGGLAASAPQIANIFPEWSDPILKWGGLITLVFGVWNSIQGRVTTTRPIG